MSMESPEDKDEITALLDLAQNSALDHIHDTCETAESTVIITVYKTSDGEFAASSCVKGNSFSLIGVTSMWLDNEKVIR